MKTEPDPRPTSTGLWLVFTLLLPFAALGVLMLPNKYEAWGESGIDCDGPMVAFVAIPTFVVYSLVAGRFLMRVVRWRQWHAAVGFIFSALIAIPLLVNGVTGIWKMREQQEACS